MIFTESEVPHRISSMNLPFVYSSSKSVIKRKELEKAIEEFEHTFGFLRALNEDLQKIITNIEKNLTTINVNLFDNTIRRAHWDPTNKKIAIKAHDEPLEKIADFIFELCNATNPSFQAGLEFDAESAEDYAYVMEQLEYHSFKECYRILTKIFEENETTIKQMLSEAEKSAKQTGEKVDPEDYDYSTILKDYKKSCELTFEEYLDSDKEHFEMYKQDFLERQEKNKKIKQMMKELDEYDKKVKKRFQQTEEAMNQIFKKASEESKGPKRKLGK